jgi:16S rRNA (guanine(966)-N(2))-methyltransferase RsmD
MRVLDLFAGTGALGLEAFSRGAEHVVFVERSRRVARDLRARLERFGLGDSDALRILAIEAGKAIARLSKEGAPRFDLVFIDAPYASGDRVGTLEALLASDLLATDAMLVVEGPKRHPVPPVAGVTVVEEHDYGESRLTWLAVRRTRDDGAEQTPCGVGRGPETHE